VDRGCESGGEIAEEQGGVFDVGVRVDGAWGRENGG
jgi:hypothetical protein